MEKDDNFLNKAQVNKFTKGIQAGRVWVNCYHLYPAHASFGGYKKSGIGRETHMMMLNQYRHTKAEIYLLVKFMNVNFICLLTNLNIIKICI
jgi:acyl-CoA reductase-like NAD-dependent aldehyde dehydrogenase